MFKLIQIERNLKNKMTEFEIRLENENLITHYGQALNKFINKAYVESMNKQPLKTAQFYTKISII